MKRVDDQVPHSDSVIGLLVGEFLADIGCHRYSPRTVGIYGQALRDFDRFLQSRSLRRVQNVTATRIEEYRRHLQQRELSPAAEETYTRGVKRFFDYLERKQMVFENPFAGTGPIHRTHRLLPVPNEAEMRALLTVPDVATALGMRTRAILEVAYSTGARLEELSRMKLSDLDLANGTVRIMGKGNRERVVPLGRSAVGWVRRYVVEVRARLLRGATTALWVKAGGGPLGSQAIGLSIHACAGKAGIETPISPHGIRRACATHMLSRGAHPVELQMLLGHASLKHLSRYLRVTFREMRAIHERSRLGQ